MPPVLNGSRWPQGRGRHWFQEPVALAPRTTLEGALAHSMPSTIEHLVELNKLLLRLRDVKHSMENLPDEMQELHAQFEEQRLAIEALDTVITEAESVQRTSEGEADQLQTRIDHYQDQIGSVSTQKEYGALLREIDAARESKRELEEAGIAALERLDTAKTEREALVAAFQETENAHKEGVAAWEAQRPELAKEADNLEGEVEVLKEKIAKPALKRYERLWERHDGDPMAPILAIEKPKGPKVYGCAVCNYQVRPQIVVELRNTGDVITCECGRQRIFYVEEPAT